MKYTIKMLAIALFTFSLSVSLNANKTATANYVYTISLGAYVDAELSDFNDLQPLGYLYATRFEDNLMQVYLGGYNSWANAKKTLPAIQDLGYPDAFVTRRSLEEGKEVSSIQVGLVAVGEAIDWKHYLKAGDVHIAQVNNQVRIMSGQFSSTLEAVARLSELKRYGFKDAFVKKINNAFLVKATSFETGGAKPDEIIVMREKGKPEPKSEPEPLPEAYDILFKKTKTTSKETSRGGGNIPSDIPTEYDAVVIPPAAPSAKMPTIRSRQKRTSALRLQEVLKTEQVYSNSLDGYYGKGTLAGYNRIKKENRQIQKYLLLSKMMDNNTVSTNVSTLQKNINNLLVDASARKGLQASRSDLAKAYRAYFLFQNKGSQKDIDKLMNAAIKGAFSSKRKKNVPKFDYSATYSYKHLDLLLLHLQYVHSVTGDAEVPCWIFSEHPKEATKAFSASSDNLKIQDCGGNFMDWESTQLLKAIATDLDPFYDFKKKESAADASERAALYLTPQALTTAEKKEIEAWNRSLWVALDEWGNSDPVHDQRCVALKVAFYQSAVHLEDYFMDKGFKYNDAKPLAMAVLKTIVGEHFGDYMKG